MDGAQTIGAADSIADHDTVLRIGADQDSVTEIRVEAIVTDRGIVGHRTLHVDAVVGGACHEVVVDPAPPSTATKDAVEITTENLTKSNDGLGAAGDPLPI